MISTDLLPHVAAALKLAHLLLDGAIAVERHLQPPADAGAGETAGDQASDEGDQGQSDGRSD